jgi:hypothetical protein
MGHALEETDDYAIMEEDLRMFGLAKELQVIRLIGELAEANARIRKLEERLRVVSGEAGADAGQR